MNLDENTRIASVQARARHFVSGGDYSGAETCLLRALRSAHLHRPERLFLWNQLGMVYKYLGRFDKSGDLYQRALREAPGCLSGAERNFFLADLYHNLGGLEHARGHFRRGEQFARKGLELRRRVASSRSLPVAVDMAALAAILDGQKKFTESETLYRRALRVYRREYGPSHGETAVLVGNLAALCQATGRFRPSLPCYRLALKMKRQEFGSTHPSVGVTLNNLGMLYHAQGKTSQAKRCFGTALRILLRAFGPRHFQYKTVKSNFSHIRSGSTLR
jgi:tetratricopeptide (TPR) repeat protein